MSAKVSVFSSSMMSWSLITHLRQMGKLAGVIVEQVDSPEVNQLIFNLNQQQIPYSVYQPDRLNSLFSDINSWQSNLGLVFFFSQILPGEVIENFSGDIFNIHASALPNYRGSMPIYWQLYNHEPATALTIHYLTNTVDDGDIVMQKEVIIHPYDNIQTLTGSMLIALSQILPNFINLWEKNGLQRQTQRTFTKHDVFARALQEKDQWIDWDCMSASDIVGAARARNPLFGGVMARSNQGVFNIMQCAVVNVPLYGIAPGTVMQVDKEKGLIVATIEQAIAIDVVVTQQGYYSGYSYAVTHKIDVASKLYGPG
ncbi:methionyl-tRNA formyltransferase [Planctobacterium marinum]|uniref:Methionyl-tRNA formyltransferase n=1 Tax=Planctobacterium marinum TaxID=1631968 RepID=A0AA48KVU9_9ALTE|nr:hypothetical protein MACH26_34160 [Planctobacterium marinum]